MPFVPKAPASCADLDHAKVSRALAKHYGDIHAAARELGVSALDLRQLTRAKPRVLEEARDECDAVVAMAQGAIIRAVYSNDPREREWAYHQVMRSWLARDHPLARARR